MESNEEEIHSTEALASAIKMWYWWRAVDRAAAEGEKNALRFAEIWQEEASRAMHFAAELEAALVFLSGRARIFSELFDKAAERNDSLLITQGQYDPDLLLMEKFLVSQN